MRFAADAWSIGIRRDGIVEQFESSLVGTGIQFSGTILVTILCAVLLRTIRRRFLSYWAIGWGCLSLALSSLLVGFALQRWQSASSSWNWLFFAIYCFGEYAAVFFWVAGCRSLTGNYALTARDWFWIAPAAFIAVVLPWTISQFSGRFDALMIIHSLIMACLLATAFAVLYASRSHAPVMGAGIGVMMAALFLLTFEFLQYAPLCGYCQWTGQIDFFPHLKYSSLYDLMLEMLLAFGMVMVVMDFVRAELEQANRELRSAGSRLNEMAQCDPMTGALNRYAFDALIREAQSDSSAFAGCVAVLDLDNLKPINDTHGHLVGDQVIRLVAQTVRSVIRPDDLLFRWGGDEFLILWLGNLNVNDASVRLYRLNDELLRAAECLDTDWVVEPGVSFGLAQFQSVAGLESAIQTADTQMYEHKAKRRGERAVLTPSFP